MKKLRNWFIGDYLSKTDNVFERAKITLTYNFAMFFLLQAALMYYTVISHHLWYHVTIISFGWITMSYMLYVIKVKQNIKLAALIWFWQFIVIGTLTMLIQGGEMDMMSGFWAMTELLFAYFTLGEIWAFVAFIHVTLQLILTIVNQTWFHGTLLEMGIPENQKLPEAPIFTIIPFSLCVYIITRFVRARRRAEKIVNEQKAELQEKNKEITDSINYAQHIQTAILPGHDIIEKHLPESFIVYLPKSIVSGDFYWVQEKDDCLFFAVGDCTGHGVPGAMMSVIAQNVLNRSIFQFNLKHPAEVLDKASELMEATLAQGEEKMRDGMDIALCIFDKKTKKLEYAGANNPLYYISGDVLYEVKASKQPVGKFESKVPFTNNEVNIKDNEWIYLFSDGMADQFGGEKGKKFKYKALKELVIKNNLQPKNIQKNALISAFHNWKGEYEQVDDVCILGVKII